MANQNQIHLAPDFTERYPGASPVATEAAMNLVRTADLLVKRIGELVTPFGLSPSSGLALGILADAEAPLPPHQIAYEHLAKQVRFERPDRGLAICGRCRVELPQPPGDLH